MARIEQYLFIPIELNTWTDDIMDSFASIGVGTRQWKREFSEYRPWTSMEQFERLLLPGSSTHRPPPGMFDGAGWRRPQQKRSRSA